MKLEMRFAVEEDMLLLKQWLSSPDILRWFPMDNEAEIDDSIRIWLIYARMHASVTATLDGQPIAMANLYIQPFQKLRHQCLFSIVVSAEYRGKGVGTQILTHLMKVAKEQGIELLHLEVYDGNPAIFLYRKLGFEEYGRHKRFIKDGPDQYVDKVLMQKFL